MSEDSVNLELPQEVIQEELEVIAARRRAAGLDVEDLRLGTPGEPSVDRGLVGLALSGGGIRSSTFGIGVIQALSRAGLFHRADYVSTVSGGGYTGSMLSSLLRDHTSIDPEDFPLDKPQGEPESRVLQHLRNGSNYLSPGGLLNAVRLPAVVVRGLLLNLLLLLPWIMLAVTLTEVAYEASQVLGWRLFREDLEFFRGDWSAILVIAPVLGGLYWVLGRLGGGSWKLRNRYELGLAAGLLVLAAVILAIPLWRVVHAAIEMPLKGEMGLEGYLDRWFSWGVWAVAAVIYVGAHAVVKASENLSLIVGKAVLLLAGVAGPGILFGLYLFLVVAQADSPFIRGPFPEFQAIQSAEDVTDSVRVGERLADQMLRKGIEYETGAVVPVVYCPAPQSEDEAPRPRAWHLARPDRIGTVTTDFQTELGRHDALYICGWAADAIEDSDYYRVAELVGEYEVIGAKMRFGGAPSDQTLLGDWLFLLIALVMIAFNYRFVDVNQSSLHGFYRDRLSRLYLFRRRGDGAVVPNDDQRLSTLNAPGSVAPYHIVNATLNLQGMTVETSRGRQSDFFFFSKKFCGGPHTGYCRTEEMERWDSHVNLGTAMAISAAAAAPNMGSTTVKPLVFILTLLNLRLGYWVPNPRYIVQGKARTSLPSRRPRTLYLFREALGALDVSHGLVNVSDGGHLENLAIYELLRRRCKVIIAVDGEADPKLGFHGLITLIRLARIDLGVDITIDLDELRLNKERFSSAHYAVGTIDYGEKDGKPQIGHLVYVKSSMTNDEDPVVKKYRAENPDFPHETTADQFFDEIQFEAYRELGNHVGDLVAADLDVMKHLRA